MTNHAARRARVAQIARDAGLNTLAFVPGANFRYLSGLDFHLMERPTVLFVTSDERVLAIMPELERSKWSATFVDATTFYWQDSEGFDGAFAAAGQVLDGPIGVEGMRMRMFEFEALATQFPQGSVRNAEADLSQLRLCKDPEEVAALRQAIKISEQALEDVISVARTGMTETDIAAALKTAMLARGAEGFAFEPLVLSGPNAADCHGSPGSRPVTAGEPLLIDFGASYGGMNADITRTFFCEHVPDRSQEIYQTVLDANARGRQIAGPGVSCSDLDAQTTEVLARSPFADLIVHKTGHGLGMDVHEAPQVMVGNTAVLQPGTVITIEPGLYEPGHLGVRIEDDVLITENGIETLTSFPREVMTFG